MGLPEKIPSVYQLALENQRLILENHDLTLQLITLLVQSKHQEPEFSLFYAHSLLEIKEWQIEHIEYLLGLSLQKAQLSPNLPQIHIIEHINALLIHHCQEKAYISKALEIQQSIKKLILEHQANSSLTSTTPDLLTQSEHLAQGLAQRNEVLDQINNNAKEIVTISQEIEYERYEDNSILSNILGHLQQQTALLASAPSYQINQHSNDASRTHSSSMNGPHTHFHPRSTIQQTGTATPNMQPTPQ